ncbi:hypothetical protein E2C01_071407 [Portunus trituberculatus]|uniref:Uncharacterized protein n=1 Tax=Portunus trituberculatus TaxID=210409 RepID=A0A5B7HWX9_PORTR|nr:hypothetical protein [Portunus trituberculatus]
MFVTGRTCVSPGYYGTGVTNGAYQPLYPQQPFTYPNFPPMASPPLSPPAITSFKPPPSRFLLTCHHYLPPRLPSYSLFGYETIPPFPLSSPIQSLSHIYLTSPHAACLSLPPLTSHHYRTIHDDS